MTQLTKSTENVSYDKSTNIAETLLKVLKHQRDLLDKAIQILIDYRSSA